MKLYRFERGFNSGSYFGYELDLRELEVLKETDKGYWVECWRSANNKKFTLKGIEGKRFAYETKEAALNNFQIRTQRSVEFCEKNLKDAKGYLDAANKIELK